MLRQAAPTADGRYDLLTVGTDRFRLVDVDRSRPYLRGEIELLPDEAATPGAAEAAAGVAARLLVAVGTRLAVSGGILAVGAGSA